MSTTIDFEVACIQCGRYYQFQDGFYRTNNSLGREIVCKSCSKRQSDNLCDYKGATFDTRDARLRFAREWKVIVGCQRCGLKYPYSGAFEYHHLDSRQKDGNVYEMAENSDWNTLKAEMKKCQILCATCHRIVHYEQRRKKRASLP